MYRHTDGNAQDTELRRLHTGRYCVQDHRLQEEINRDIDRLVDLKREIMSVIKAVDDAEYQILLEKRYLCFQTWEQIAAEMNYGVRYVHCMHGKALLAVEALMKQVCCK